MFKKSSSVSRSVVARSPINSIAYKSTATVSRGDVPSLYLDFTSGTLDSKITFTRNSLASYIGIDGIFKNAANNEPRFSYDPAIVLAQNLVHNSANMTGFVVNSAGTITAQQVGTGTDSFGTYGDFRFFGTSTSNAYPAIRVVSSIDIVKGMSLASSCLVQIVSGSSPKPINFVQQELNNSGTYIRGLGTANINLSATTPTRYTIANQTAQDVATTKGCILITPSVYSAGDVVDVTIRVWLPQANYGTTLAAYTPTFGTPTTQCAAKGLLIEEQRSNLLLWSRDLSNAAWGKTDVTILQNQTGIDGIANSASFVTEGNAGTSSITQSATIPGNATVTYSRVLRRGSADWVRIAAANLANNGCAGWFNIATGVRGTVSAIGTGSGVSSTITNMGKGWFRCTITFTLPDAGTSINTNLYAVNADNSVLRVPNATYGADFAQLEVGASATSIIATTTASATRITDVAKMTGTNFSSWYNPLQSTFVVRANTDSITSQRGVISVNNTGINDKYDIRYRSPQSIGSLSGAGIWTLGSSVFDNNFHKIAVSIEAGSQISTLDAGTVFSATAPTLPPVNQLQIGGLDNGTGQQLNGHIQQIVYYPIKVSATKLTSLTI